MRGGGEVGREGAAWGLTATIAAVLGPYLGEEESEEPAALGGLGLGVPEAREVFEERLGAVEVGVGGWGEALQLLLHRLAAHDVLGLGDVAHDV